MFFPSPGNIFLSHSFSPCSSPLSIFHAALDFIVGWQASSYAINEDDGSSPEICATGSGTLQNNLILDITAATVDGTATGDNFSTDIVCSMYVCK